METEDRYERLECIGRGSYGNVFKGYVLLPGPHTHHVWYVA